MSDFLESIYPALGSVLYLAALMWVMYLGADHAATHSRHAVRAWKRIRPAVWAFVAAWIVSWIALVFWRVPSDLLMPGANHCVFEGIQMFAAWVAFPAGLWFVARAGGWGRGGSGGRHGHWLLGSVAVGFVAILFSQLAMISLPFQPALSPEAERLFQPTGWRAVGLILGILMAAPIEEILFRLTIQGRLEVWARERGWSAVVPVVVTSFLWSLGHAGVVDPAGVKEIQIFLLGLLFGWTRRRWGIAGAIVAHGALNSYACISQIIQWIHQA